MFPKKKKLLVLALLLLLTFAFFQSRMVPSTATAQSNLLQAIEYLGEVAFGSEYGNVYYPVLRLIEPLKIYIEGYYTPEDIAFIEQFLNTLSQKILQIKVELVSNKASANTIVYFVPLDQLKEYLSSYVKGNWGFFEVGLDYHYIKTITIGIASDVTSQLERNHLFMEELIGALGLSKDSMRYPDSILYQEWTTVQEPSELDWLCLELYYADYVKPGMNFQQMKKAILDNVK